MPKNDGNGKEGGRLLVLVSLVLAAALIYVTMVQTGAIAALAQPAAPGQPANAVAAPVGRQANASHPPADAELKRIVGNFDAYAEKARQDWEVPGMAIAIVKGDEVLLSRGYGVKTIGGSDPVTENTVFQIASTSKAFASAVVAMEVDRGAIKWDDRVVGHLPDFQMNDSWVTGEMTITDTLAHHSGLSTYWGDELMVLGYNDSYSIHSLRYAVPVSSFRAKYAYQNVVYSIPTAIVEKTTGKSWGENLQSRIFTPLGMSGTSADYQSFKAAGDVASPHMYSIAANGSQASVLLPEGSPLRNMTYLQPGAGGINSNAHDMANWLIFQMGNGTYKGQKLLSEENLDYTHFPRTPIPTSGVQDAQFYCQGWLYSVSKYGPIVWHSGAVGGYHNYVAFSPKDKVGIVILTNNIQASLADALFAQFFSMYYGNEGADMSGEYLKMFKAQNAAALASGQATPVAANASLPLSAYAGAYTNTPYGTAAVSEQGGNLTMKIGPAQYELLLVPQGGNAFRAIGTQASWQVEFGADGGGQVKNATVVMNSGTALFTRE